MNEELSLKPRCQIIGTDGNVFSIIGTVARCLNRAGMKEQADEWTKRAAACSSYDEVLRLMFEYVEVEGEEGEPIYD